ncbi:MAG: ABC transporter substrate-binding protein [Clostridia bacterium]
MKNKKIALLLAACMITASFTACTGEVTPSASTESSTSSEESSTVDTSEEESSEEVAELTNEERIIIASEEGTIGNWGLGNEYEILALLAKYELPLTFLSQNFDMDAFDNDSITLASAMTYNELGLVINDYDGGYGYGDTVDYITMNEEGVAMLEDNIFCTAEFAEENPNTVAAFVQASLKGWEYACANPEEAAEIVYNAGSSVSSEHQLYMAEEVAKLVTTDTTGATVSDYGYIDEDAMAQTLELAQQYLTFDDSTAVDALAEMTTSDLYDSSFLTSEIGELEKTEVSIQLKWLPQAQFMGYYVAEALGYYEEVGLTVNIVSGGGDIGETTAVYNGTVDFGVTWVSNLISANSAGMDLLEVAQVYQSSGLVLVYKK